MLMNNKISPCLDGEHIQLYFIFVGIIILICTFLCYKRLSIYFLFFYATSNHRILLLFKIFTYKKNNHRIEGKVYFLKIL